MSEQEMKEKFYDLYSREFDSFITVVQGKEVFDSPAFWEWCQNVLGVDPDDYGHPRDFVEETGGEEMVEFIAGHLFSVEDVLEELKDVFGLDHLEITDIQSVDIPFPGQAIEMTGTKREETEGMGEGHLVQEYDSDEIADVCDKIAEVFFEEMQDREFGMGIAVLVAFCRATVEATITMGEVEDDSTKGEIRRMFIDNMIDALGQRNAYQKLK